MITDDTRVTRAGGNGKAAFYRFCRILHSYLSALAFITLAFFSATGVLLNHPEWFANYQPAQTHAQVRLAPAAVAAAAEAPDPGAALARLVGRQRQPLGAYSSADVDSRHALIRFDGPKGAENIDIDLRTGVTNVTTSHADLSALMLDLHRGKNSGAVWRGVIDVSAYIVLALSLVGYVLFFSLRFRLVPSLVLTGLSIAVLVGVAVWAVP